MTLKPGRDAYVVSKTAVQYVHRFVVDEAKQFKFRECPHTPFFASDEVHIHFACEWNTFMQSTKNSVIEAIQDFKQQSVMVSLVDLREDEYNHHENNTV